MSQHYEQCPWLNPVNWDGSCTTQKEKNITRFEWAFESKTEKNSKFKDNLSDYQQEHLDN